MAKNVLGMPVPNHPITVNGGASYSLNRGMAPFLLLACLAFLPISSWSQANDPASTSRVRQMKVQTPSAAPVDPTGSAPPANPITFVDAHVHLNDPAMQLDLMKRWGASGAVVFWGGRSNNESVAEAARAFPDRLIPFASISPERTAYRPAWIQFDETLLKQLDDLLATGLFKGIGEISAVHFPSAGFDEADFSPLSPMVTGIMELARKHRVPVMLHVESTRMAELSQLLERFPDVPAIWAHGGYTPLFLARRMLERHPNLYYELSARTWPHHPRSPDYTILRDGHQVWPEWLRLIEAMPHRFMVGTDASNRSVSADAMKFASVQNFLSQLSPAAREQVGSGTLLKLVGTREK
ncbi:putative TIM-barrel fold metal-dependent hydrolase [Ottowia thiooxydans]|uniref:TIM-barrel fold metal-dependent hydrolase n=2 Tax=Ottowia thiooxydans TaxID=219182 RepID=A0ABV2Q5C1_9BURK